MRKLKITRVISWLTGAVLAVALGACSNPAVPSALGSPSSIGDPAQGQTLILKLGCGSCHSIPGVQEAHGMVGPPLEHVASRQYIAGVLRNSPDNMIKWLRFPQHVVPGNAMPDLAISDTDARQITAYLATLE